MGLDAGLVSSAAGLGISQLTIKNLTLDIKVAGPTATTEVKSGTIPDLTLVLASAAGGLTQGPFTGTLTDVGKGGIIKYSAAKISLTIVVVVAGTENNVNIVCSAPGTVAITSIKIPGSPDIVQPIEIAAAADQLVSVDVLGKYVTNGKTAEGVEMPVDPSTLKVLEGPGTVSGGQIQVQAGAAGSVASVTFEVCSGTLPGVNEVQRLAIDPSPEALKKGIAFSLQLGEHTTPPIDLLGFPFQFFQPAVNDWVNQANNYIFTIHELPSAADIDAALEVLPNSDPAVSA